MIEASHFDPAVAYVAVDRHRLDDYAPHLYRTRDYGKTWQAITNGIGPQRISQCHPAGPQKQNLLFAGTELGVYVSFDEGDHWQPLQLNLPYTSVRDADRTRRRPGHRHSRARLLDSRQHHAAAAAQQRHRNPAGRLLRSGECDSRRQRCCSSERRCRPEEPTAKNPPDGAMMDYDLKSARDRSRSTSTTRTTSWCGMSAAARSRRSHPPLPIAERWFPKPSMLETSPGMHRYVWDLRWGEFGRRSSWRRGRRAYGSPLRPAHRARQLHAEADGRRQELHAAAESHHGSALAGDAGGVGSSSRNSACRSTVRR